jgi:VanZ family protein
MQNLFFFRLWFGLGVGLITAILLGSLWPSPVTLEIPNEDKVVHVLAYALLMGWFVQMYSRRVYHHGFAVLFMMFGLLIEGLQGMSGTRFAEWNDVLANTIGIAIAWGLGATRFKSILWRVDQILMRWWQARH